MSAEWDCQRHGTSNIGSCKPCDIEDAIHYECKQKCEGLEADLAKARAALQRIVNCHGEDECGVCGSLRIASEALKE